VDLIDGATPLPEFVHPPRAFYIFGPEDGTLDPATFAGVRHVVYVPTHGCMNLAASVNVILYDRSAKAWLTD
ncbi:MAG: TrmH family RNA methyltransferase, partial [Shewanella sp.]